MERTIEISEIGGEGMEKTKIALYEKNTETGMLENLLGNYAVENVDLIDTIHGINEGGLIKVYVFITVDREIADWEFNAIYDYYDTSAIKEMDVIVEEKEDCYNPTWLLIFNYVDNNEEMENKLDGILFLHKKELETVYDEIKDKKGEYE
jgi:hypothetical protein